MNADLDIRNAFIGLQELSGILLLLLSDVQFYQRYKPQVRELEKIYENASEALRKDTGCVVQSGRHAGSMAPEPGDAGSNPAASPKKE